MDQTSSCEEHLSVKITDFLSTLYCQHIELKRKTDKRDQIHRVEISKLKYKICQMDKALKSFSLEPAQSQIENSSSDEFSELKKSSQLILSGYAELQKEFVETNVESTHVLSESQPNSNRVSSSSSENNSMHQAMEQCCPSTLIRSKQRRNGSMEMNLRKQGLVDVELRWQWTFWVYRKNKKYSYEENLLEGSSFATWENFMSILRAIRSANDLQINSKYIVFKSGLKPIFTDPGNVGGGKWIMVFRKEVHQELNKRWRELLLCVAMGAFGENGKYISGVEVSVRKKVDKISMWISNGVTQDTAWSIRNTIEERLFLDNTVQLKFKLHPKDSYQDGFSDFCF